MKSTIRQHLIYKAAAETAFKNATISACGVVSFAIFSAACIFKGIPAGAVACAMATVFCGFGMWINTIDYRECQRKAWLTKPRPEDCL